ncbi:MAG: DUF354 domain-containing protein [Anaerolineales bacterium]
MKILVDINHPSQVHLFKHAIRRLQARNHSVLIIARDKDVTLQLLEEYGFEYVPGTVRRPGLFNLLYELFSKTLLIWRESKKFDPDVFISLGSPPAAWAAFLRGKPHLAFTDTEHSVEQLVLYKPFSMRIYTPDCFLLDLGVKQRRYAGYHELAYLHPSQFTPSFEVIREFGLSEEVPFFVVRFVSFSATHDIRQTGLSLEEKDDLLKLLQSYGQVVVSSEAAKGMTVLGFSTQIPPSKMHHLLAYAALFIGEGTTMATEAALLGIPAITLTPHEGGNRLELENKYGLVRGIRDPHRLKAEVIKLLQDKDLKRHWQEKRAKLLSEKIDVTEFIVSQIEGFENDKGAS